LTTGEMKSSQGTNLDLGYWKII